MGHFSKEMIGNKKQLSANQWAWEFLRRNKEYQKNYQWFISTWRELEKDYGQPPNMDHLAWKQDPRSYKLMDINDSENTSCAVSDNKLLIECWMGYKWNFFQFPVDPVLNSYEIKGEIQWRPIDIQILAKKYQWQENCQQLSYHIEFDLTQTLKEQFEQLKQQVAIAQRHLKHDAIFSSYSIQGRGPSWQKAFAIFDSTPSAIERSTSISEQDILLLQEIDYYIQNYLTVLTFMPK